MAQCALQRSQATMLRHYSAMTSVCQPASRLSAAAFLPTHSSLTAAASSSSSSAAFTTAAARRTRIVSASATSCPATLPSSSSSSSCRHFHSSSSLSASFQPSGSRASGVPYRHTRHDAIWDQLRKRPKRLTTVDPDTPKVELSPNEFELNQLSLEYGLTPLPTIPQRRAAYEEDQHFYVRRDARIRQHLNRLLRMRKLSKKEMLILLDQIEYSKWNLDYLQKAYLPEIKHHAEEEEELHRKSLRVGTGGQAYAEMMRKHEEEKRAKRKENGPKERKPHKKWDIPNDGESKFGYRKDLANTGPENWDYLTPYVILEPEANQLSNLDAAFRYEDRYVLWEEEHRLLAEAEKLQKMKQLGIPFEHAETLPAPISIKYDMPYPTKRIRQSLNALYERGMEPTQKHWYKWSRPPREGINDRGDIFKRRDARLVAAARRHIPAYIRRFEREATQQQIDVGQTTVLAQNVALQELIDREKCKPSLLTQKQQQSCKNLLGVFAERNRLAIRKMVTSTANQYERLMIERAIEQKYLERYLTIASDYLRPRDIAQMEKEMMERVNEIHERYQNINWTVEAIKLRDSKREEEHYLWEKYVPAYEEKANALIAKHGAVAEAKAAAGEEAEGEYGERAWIDDLLKWEKSEDFAVKEAKTAEEQRELDEKTLAEELHTWNDFYDVEVATELGKMIDCGELVAPDLSKIPTGAVELAEKRVAKRLNATRQEWLEWKYRPQYRPIEEQRTPPDLKSEKGDSELLAQKEKEEEEAQMKGQEVIRRLLKSDPMLKASAAWKARMGPRFADIDRIQNSMKAGSITSRLDFNTGKVRPVTAIAASGSGEPVVNVQGSGDKKNPSVLPTYDSTLSTAGHALLDLSNPAARAAALQHTDDLDAAYAVGDEYNVHIEEDPMAIMLDQAYHDANEPTAAAAKAKEEEMLDSQMGEEGAAIEEGGKGGDEEGEEEDKAGAVIGVNASVDTTDPTLGFPDDDFRLYDPILMTEKMDKKLKLAVNAAAAHEREMMGMDAEIEDDAEEGEEEGAVDEDGEGGEGEGEGEGGSDGDIGGPLLPRLLKRFQKFKSAGRAPYTDRDDPQRDYLWEQKERDMAYRRQHYLDLDPFGPANTDERRDYDDQYFFLDEEAYALKKRTDPETNHQKPLTMQMQQHPDDGQMDIIQFDLSDETHELLYLLHRSDPVKWTPRALAHRFRLSAKRVKSVLIMQAIHYRMIENGVLHPLMLEYDEERAADDLISPKMNMIHDVPEFPIQPLPDYRWVREDDVHRVLAEERAVEGRYFSRSQRLDRAEEEYYARWGAIGVDPPPLPEPQLLDDRLMPPTRHNLMMIDISELPAARFGIAVRDRRGWLREPDENEYQYVRKQEKGKFPFTYIAYYPELETPL